MLFRTNQLVTLNMPYLRTSRVLHVFFSEVLPSYNFIIVSFLMLLSRFYRDKLMKLKISRIYINNVIFSFSFNEKKIELLDPQKFFINSCTTFIRF